MEWSHDGTERNAFWIGAGNGREFWSTGSGSCIITDDVHDAPGHDDRRTAARVRQGGSPAAPDGESIRVRATPEQMAAAVLAGFPERFEWALDDLRGIVTPHPVVADGWGVRPELVAPVADPARMVVLVPTDEWRRWQAAHLPRAARVGHAVSDPQRAARNRLERDRLVAADAVAQARRLGIRVIDVDGCRDAGEVAGHFGRAG